MQDDFHYYATYCAAYIAGYSHEESQIIAYSDNFTDHCTKTFLDKVGGPSVAATTQLNMEMTNTRADAIGLQRITRIWSSFHFLPGDLYAEVKGCKSYRNRYRLICRPNSDLVVKTVNHVKNRSLQAIGIAMHVICDTWAHQYFAGTPSFVINDVDFHFYEIMPDGTEEKLEFMSKPGSDESVETRNYIRTIYHPVEGSIMNLGHGRCGHLPDYSFMRYKYAPAWAKHEEVIKDNPSDYLHAFTQMIHAFRFLRGDVDTFEKDVYAMDAIEEWKDEICAIFEKRQLNASEDWKVFGERLSGQTIEVFDPTKYDAEYMNADDSEKRTTFLGKFFLGAVSHKNMVVHEIYKSGNKLAGLTVLPKKRILPDEAVSSASTKQNDMIMKELEETEQ